MSEKKYIVVLGDGMADEPIESLGGKTPIAYASTPALDRLSKLSEIGMVHTIPEGMKPGSDTANLSFGAFSVRGLKHRCSDEGYRHCTSLQHCNHF